MSIQAGPSVPIRARPRLEELEARDCPAVGFAQGAALPPQPRPVAGPPVVNLFDPSNNLRARFVPLSPTTLGLGALGLNTALGDVNGDRIDDLAIATNQGGFVRVFDGSLLNAGVFQEQAVIAQFLPFQPFNYFGPISLAFGDFNADGRDDLAMGVQQGLPLVRVADGFFLSRGVLADLGLFLAFNAPGGITVSAGNFDLDRRGTDDLVVGSSLFPVVTIVNGAFLGVSPNGFIADAARLSFFSTGFGTTFNGVTVAAGDLDGDGRDDLVLSLTEQSFSALQVFNGRVVNGTGGFLSPFSSSSLVTFPGSTGGFGLSTFSDPSGRFDSLRLSVPAPASPFFTFSGMGLSSGLGLSSLTGFGQDPFFTSVPGGF